MMSQYERICLNNADYDWIYQRIPEKTECWICQNYSECVWYSTEHKVIEFTEQLPRQTYSEHCRTFKIKHFAKKNNAWMQVRNQKFLRAGGRVCATRALQKHNGDLSFQNQETFFPLVERLWVYCSWIRINIYEYA